jgi:hypothetical protein
MITEKKKTALSFLSSRKHYIVSCDICKQDEGSGFTTDIGTYSFYLGNLRPYCNSCFSKGLEHWRGGEQLNVRSEYDCVICGKKLAHSNPAEINLNVKLACFPCHLKHQHPDSLHGFGDISRFKDWDSCYKCGGLRIKDKNNNYSYYAIGIGKLSTTPACKALATDKYSCKHKYVMALDSTKNQSEVKKITSKDIRDVNDGLSIPGKQEMIPISKFDMAYGRCGYKLMWCEKCGATDRKLPDWWPDVV